MFDNTTKLEKAIAVSFSRKGTDRDMIFEQLNELEALATTAGAEVIEKIYQELFEPNPATAIGKGKVEEIKLAILENEITLVIFDDDLTPAQLRNLENEFQIKVIDRSGLILDIFAKHAKSLEAKTQVELAQSQYLLPRLTRMWTHLSKQFGGIGTKGPGETQIEADRRALKTKIQKLKEKLEEITVQKEQQSKGRSDFPQFALIGYTNAGKSTLMNAITEANVYVEDKLFATLDTTVRTFTLPNNKKALISDTVGFIRKLPTHLVASFRSTLMEARNSDILIHVVDISHKYFREHIKVVNDTLDFLKIADKPIIVAFNKIDLIKDYYELRSIEKEYPNSIFISAERSINIQNILSLMQSKLDEQNRLVKLLLPYKAMDLISNIYSKCEIVTRNDNNDGILLEIKVTKDGYSQFEHIFSKFIIN